MALCQAELASAQKQLERLKNGERPEKRRALASREAARRWCMIGPAPTGSVLSSLPVRRSAGSSVMAIIFACFRPRRNGRRPGRITSWSRHRRVRRTWPSRGAGGQGTGPVEGRPGRVGQDAVAAAGGWGGFAGAGRAGGKHRARQCRPGLDHGGFVPAAGAGFCGGTGCGPGGGGSECGDHGGWDAGQDVPGKVGVVVPRMGKRGPQTEAPDNQYRDVYYREVLIDLEGNEPLPTNFRVQVRITVPTKETL